MIAYTRTLFLLRRAVVGRLCSCTHRFWMDHPVTGAPVDITPLVQQLIAAGLVREQTVGGRILAGPYRGGRRLAPTKLGLIAIADDDRRYCAQPTRA